MNGYDPTPNDPANVTPGPDAAFPGQPASAADPYGAPGNPYSSSYGAPNTVPPTAAGLPNPALATFLGFIPGVGAMYNGQFAKGLAQIVIFAVLVSLEDHVNHIFGLLVIGWVFYMVFDSYQTARARRDGLQLPDPFGLNNIGERMGVGNGPNWSDFTARPVPGQVPPASGYTAPPTPPYAPQPPVGSPNPADAYPPAPATAYASRGAEYSAPAYPAAEYAAYASPTAAYAPSPYPTSAPPYVTPPFDPAVYTPPLPPLAVAGGLPTGALWLIGFGVFALAGTLSHRLAWSNRFLDGAIVLAVGLALLVTRTIRARTVYPAGSAAATWYILRSMRPGLILLAIGFGLTLEHLGAVTWGTIWPWLLILFGVYLLLERAAHNRMLAAGPVAPLGADPVESANTPPYSTGGSFVPPTQPHDEEGRVR